MTDVDDVKRCSTCGRPSPCPDVLAVAEQSEVETNLDRLRRDAYERHIDWLERNEPR